MQLGKLFVDDNLFLTILRKHEVSKIFLFGSSVREDFNNLSDIDLIVEFKNSKGKSLFDLIELKQSLKDLTGRKIDLIENGAVNNPFRKKEIQKSIRLIYAA